MSEQEDTPNDEAAPGSDAPAEEPAPEAREDVVQEKRKPQREAAAPAGPSTAVILPKNVPGSPIITRRQVLAGGFWISLGAIVAGVGACGLDVLYPTEVKGFGGTFTVEPGEVPGPGEKSRIGRGHFWLVSLTEDQGGPGLLALWWKCPHLGCTVPWKEGFVWPDPTTGADKLGWFRCPCHGSTYTDAGVRVFGPAPRSMDTMAISFDGDRVIVDTGSRVKGAPDNPSRAVRP